MSFHRSNTSKLSKKVMPISIEFDKKLQILRGKLTGPLNLIEYKALMQQITSDIEFPANVAAIWDLREFDFVDFDSNKAENTSAIHGQFKNRKGAKNAYVVSDALGYGMTRLFLHLLRINDDSFVSYSYETAEIWLTNTPQQKH